MLTTLSQPFWGDMVSAAGAGPSPIQSKVISSKLLQEEIKFCLSTDTTKAAREIARKIHADSGVAAALALFHSHLDHERLSCDVLPGHPAVWAYSGPKRSLKLSKIGAEVLVNQHQIDQKDLKMLVESAGPCQ